jgi:hypothetical protein
MKKGCTSIIIAIFSHSNPVLWIYTQLLTWLSGNWRGELPDLGVRACVRTRSPPNPGPLTANPNEPLTWIGRFLTYPL